MSRTRGRVLEITLGDRVRRTRRSLGLTQPEFANLVGCAFATIVKAESDVHVPTPGMLEKIAAAADVDLAWLATGATSERALTTLELGQRIARVRRLFDMTQWQFADALGRSRGSVADWERGHKLPRQRALDEIVAYSGVDATWLAGGLIPWGKDDSYPTADDVPPSDELSKGGTSGAPATGLEPVTVRLTVGCSAN